MDQTTDTRGSFCRGCQTNWSILPMSEGDGDDQYEYCPLCRTDEHLQAGHAVGSFSFSMITGEKIDNITGLPVQAPLPEPPEVDLKEAEGRASSAYLKAYKEGGHYAGEKAYYSSLRSSK